MDMSLDDLIKKSKSNYRHASGSGPTRRVATAVPATRSAPYPPPPPPPPPKRPLIIPTATGLGPGDVASLYGIYTDHVAAAMVVGSARPAQAKSLEMGTKLHVSNLGRDVASDDIMELFSEVGELKQFSINYDSNGKSKGTAEVVFTRRADALASIQRYNNVQLDGMPMKIELIGTEFEVPPAKPFLQNRTFGNPNAGSGSASGRGSSAGRLPRGGGSGEGHGGGRGGGRDRGRGKGSGRERGRQEKKSAADLDAELDMYHAEAKQAK